MRGATRMMMVLLALSAGCYRYYPSEGGGQTAKRTSRVADAKDVLVPDGYRVEKVLEGLNLPTSVTFDDQGRMYVLESGYAYGEVFTEARLLRVDGQQLTPIASGDNGPWTGVVFTKGAFYIAEGGVKRGGGVVRVTPDGNVTRIAEGFPTQGDHHTNGPAVGPDGMIYVGLGTMTNSGVVGPDNFAFGWLDRHPDQHDVPCRDIKLAGVNYRSKNVLKRASSSLTASAAAVPAPQPQRGMPDEVMTGAFLPFGTPSLPNEVIPGKVPCSGSILKINPDGGQPELVAWGFRNPFGLAFAPDGNLFVTDNGYDDRGSRPVYGAADLMFLVQPGRWYGWPDFADGRNIDQKRYGHIDKHAPQRVLAEEPGQPPRPTAWFGCHSSADGLDFSRSNAFGHVGEAFVALFGDQAPVTGKVEHPVGFKVVTVNPETGVIHDFMANRGRWIGPGTKRGTHGLERPVSVRFSPTGDALYVVDFGVMTMGKDGAKPAQNTGVIWRIVPTGGV